MSRPVKEIAESDHACCLTGEVQREPGSTAADQSRYWVQFLTAAAEIVAGHHEVSRAEGGICGKQNAVVTIPKSMIAVRLGWSGWLC